MWKHRIRLEWKPSDCWVGAFWKKSYNRFDLWICLVPMVPIHYWRGKVYVDVDLPLMEDGGDW